MRWTGKIQPIDSQTNGMTVIGTGPSAGKTEKGKKRNAGGFLTMKMMIHASGGNTGR